MEPADLEVIPPEGEQPGALRTSRPRRRWPWLALLGVVAIGAGAYTLAARSAVRALEEQWLAACDVAVRAQDSPNPNFQHMLFPEERQLLERDAKRVEREVLADIRRSVRRVRTIDPGVRRLRDAVYNAVYDAAQPLHANACVPPRRAPSRPIDATLRAELKRWRLSPATEVAHSVALPPVTVTTLPIATAPTDTTLVLAGGSSLFVVDIDAGTTREIPDAADGFVSGEGWLVWRRGTNAFFERLGEPPRMVGSASYLVPAATDESVWLVTTTGESEQAREFDTRRGTERGPAVTLPPHARLVGAVTNGLLLSSELSAVVEVWDPVAARTRLTVGVTDRELLARGNVIAWSTCEPESCQLHLTDASTGRQRVVPLDGTTISLAISPDGRSVAAAVQLRYRNAGDVELVDVATGHVQWLRSSWIGSTAMAWGRSGDRIFLASGFAASELWMSGLSDRSPSEQLRVRVPSPYATIAVL